ncbi:pleckstrin homology domain-containing family S member 1-like [Paramisgurnus dabryanus]|uniref:pleckstrin homology domain-containing family S member 1-like n=1 Tax=Paramisgurnus dabryanus TaxID=90735 RepID=UPI003CCF8623
MQIKCFIGHHNYIMADSEYVFYIDGPKQEVCAGYLYKSPPENQFKTLKSWKRRYFVLSKCNDHTCQLKYYKSPEDSKPLGSIDLSKVTYMFLHPEMQAMWTWIQKNFRCSSSCVMFMKVPERDYFLIGENSWEMEKWFNALFETLNNRPHRLLNPKVFGTFQNISELPQSTIENNQDTDLGFIKYNTHELPMLPSLIHEPVYDSPVDYKSDQSDSIQMFSRNKSSATAPKVQVLYAGYLYKSPNLSKPAKLMKSWRHRFFVLSKADEDNYQLAYYKNREKMEKPLGKIDLSMVRLICTAPEKHQMWEWIRKNFKCLPSSVLFLRVEDFMTKYARDYFLIGENSEDVKCWQNELLKVIKTQTSQNKETDYDLQQDRLRAESEPIPKSPHCYENISPTSMCRQSLPEGTLFYQVPDNTRKELSSVYFTDDDDDDTEEQPETPDDNNEYMDMTLARVVLQQNQQEEDAFFQKNMSTNGLDSSQDLCDGAENPMKRNSAELGCSMGSLPDFNGNCASTEMNTGFPNKSETHKPVQKEICINRNDLCKSLIFTQKEGKPCVYECKAETSHLFHKGDQILALNDLQIETVDEIQTYIRRLTKDEVKLTILRHPGSQPFYAELLRR